MISQRVKNLISLFPFSIFFNYTKYTFSLSLSFSCLLAPPAMASSPTALLTPATATPKPQLGPIKSKHTPPTTNTTSIGNAVTRRRDMLSKLTAGIVVALVPATPARAASDEEYVKETEQVITKVRSTITMEKSDPNIANAVADLRDTSNYWVAKYRREKALLGRASFRDIYSALNAVSGHYISFGPTAPIPAKRRQRILEEIDTAEKALQRGR